jgi:hypothetical protein
LFAFKARYWAPLCLIFQLTDSYAFGGELMQSLPSSPGHFMIFQLLFGTPHILASGILITSNKDYFSYYQKKILWMTLALMLFFSIATQFVSYHVIYIMVASWTVYHVLKQQHGIGRGIYQLPTWAFYLLLWLSIGAGISVYMGIFLKNTLTKKYKPLHHVPDVGLISPESSIAGYKNKNY